VTLVLDAGALIALERNDRSMWVRLRREHSARRVPVTHAGIVGQVWRGGTRQACLAHALAGINVRPIDGELGRSAGSLLAVAGMSDVIDAALVLLARDGDEIVTLDIDDVADLAAAADRHVEVVRP
jgi:hypothetical protein